MNTAINNQNFVIGKKALEQALSIRQKKFDVFESLKSDDAVLEAPPLHSDDESKAENPVGPKLINKASRAAPSVKI